MPAAMAAFAEDSKSGDMYIPENYTTGKPIKSISEGVSVKLETEQLACDLKSMDVGWSSSEKALHIIIDTP